jgi:hypothetical protein
MYRTRHVRLIYLAPPMFNSTNKSQTVKRILASLFVTSVAICSASAANAQLPSTPAVSIHSGNVPSACTVTALPGTLSGLANTSSIDSLNALGKFTAICNSSHAFKVEILNTGTKPLSIPSAANYVEKFRLLNASNGNTGINTTSFSAAAFTSPALSPTTATGYTVDVAAQASVDSGYTLPSGANGVSSYIINVQATLVSP